jgi:hypothetical protein
VVAHDVAMRAKVAPIRKVMAKRMKNALAPFVSVLDQTKRIIFSW